jgi:septal ring factor EnvC (AmiA/AmiB activator)
MVDVDTVLQGVQERDKWRHRLELLERSLSEVQERRRRLETRLRRLRKELSKLRVAADSLGTIDSRLGSLEVSSASHGPILR